MDEKKNNILFLEQFGNHIGGGQIILLGILEYLQKTEQWNIFVSLPEEGVFTDLLRKMGFKCVITPMVKHSMKSSFLIDISRYSFTSIRSAYTLSKLIQKHRIRIVYCNGGRTFMSSILLSLIHPLDLYWHIHLILDGRQKRMVKFFGRSKKVKRLIAVSETAKEVLKGSISYHKTNVIPNWVRPEFLTHPIPDKSRFSGKAPIKMIVIGLISREKGQINFLESLAKIPSSLPITITFAGNFQQDNEEDKQKFLELVETLNQKGWTINTKGFQMSIRELLDEMDVLLIPSLVPESFGLTAIEAMARKVLVVANKVGAIPEIIKHNENGLLYEAEEPKNLISVLNFLVKDVDTLEVIRHSGYETIRNKYNPTKQIILINQLLNQSITSPTNANHDKLQKILFVDQYSNMRGGQRVLLQLIAVALNSNISTSLMIPIGGSLEQEVRRRFGNLVIIIPIDEMKLSDGKKIIIDYFKMFLYTYKFLINSKIFKEFDNIYVNGGRLYFPSFIISLFINRKFTYHIHVDYPPYVKKLLKSMLKAKSTNKFILISSFVYNQLKEYDNCFKNSDKIHIIENSLSQKFSNFEFINRHQNTDLKICIIGKISAEKGQDIVIRLAKRYSKIQFFIIGSSNFTASNYEKNLIDNSTDNVKFTGEVLNINETIDEFGINVSLVPSRWNEPFGLVSIESMALSCITIVSDKGELPNIASNTGAYVFSSFEELCSIIDEVTKFTVEQRLMIAKKQFSLTKLKYSFPTYSKAMSELLKR